MSTLYIINSNFVFSFFSKHFVSNSSVCSNYAICATDFKFKELCFISNKKCNILEHKFVQVYLAYTKVKLQPINCKY